MPAIEIDVSADIAKFKSSMDKAAAEGKALNKKLSKAFSSIGKVMKSIGTLAGVAVAGGLGTMAKKAIDAADAVGKLATRTGASVKFLSEMKFALSQSDVSASEFATSLNKLNKSTADAAAGLSTPKRAFEALGISVKSFLKLNTDEKFTTLSEAISKIKDPALRTQVSMDLMGRSGSQLLTVMENGAMGLEAYRQESIKMGHSLTEDQAKGAAAANDALDHLSSSISGAFMQATIQYTDELKAMADVLREYLPKSIEFVINVFRGLKAVIQGVVLGILEGWQTLFEALERVPLIGEKFAGAAEFFRESSEIMQFQLDENIAKMNGLADASSNVVEVSQITANAIRTVADATADSNKATIDGTAANNKGSRSVSKVSQELKKLESNLQGVIQSTRTSGELIRQEYEESTTVLRNALNQGLIDQTEFNDLRYRLEQEHNAAVSSEYSATLGDQANEYGIFTDTIDDLRNGDFDGAKHSFGNILDEWKNMLVSMALEYAALKIGDWFGVDLGGIFGDSGGNFSFGGGNGGGAIFGGTAGQAANGAGSIYGGYNDVQAGADKGGTAGAVQAGLGGYKIYQGYQDLTAAYQAYTSTTAATSAQLAATVESAVGNAAVASSATTTATTTAATSAELAATAQTAAGNAAAGSAATTGAVTGTATTAAQFTAGAAIAGVLYAYGANQIKQKRIPDTQLAELYANGKNSNSNVGGNTSYIGAHDADVGFYQDDDSNLSLASKLLNEKYGYEHRVLKADDHLRVNTLGTGTNFTENSGEINAQVKAAIEEADKLTQNLFKGIEDKGINNLSQAFEYFGEDAGESIEGLKLKLNKLTISASEDAASVPVSFEHMVTAVSQEMSVTANVARELLLSLGYTAEETFEDASKAAAMAGQDIQGSFAQAASAANSSLQGIRLPAGAYASDEFVFQASDGGIGHLGEHSSAMYGSETVSASGGLHVGNGDYLNTIATRSDENVNISKKGVLEDLVKSVNSLSSGRGDSDNSELMAKIDRLTNVVASGLTKVKDQVRKGSDLNISLA